MLVTVSLLISCISECKLSFLCFLQIGEVQGCDGALDEREKDIRNHFTNRCSHLYMQLTSATSQAALYQNESLTGPKEWTKCIV
ncbi:hypothetical protein E2C01_087875 [Portunus trituberculatus]|uniref:Secreted protein n=1 Tax=Portunus trituberculatus TaxID=210409 RepID=A0A5B7JD10_PORTR|nr:hypothetical protein [Portunus trituberculatus]